MNIIQLKTSNQTNTDLGAAYVARFFRHNFA